MTADTAARLTRRLEQWADAVDSHWQEFPGPRPLGCYGPGYRTWGVQSNWNYLAALATLSAQPGVQRPAHWRARALAALRYALASHTTGDRPCPDGAPWGCSWISVLGPERAFHGLVHLDPFLDGDDRAALRRMVTREAGWILREMIRGRERGLVANEWNHSGRNVPESNIWNGAFLWRAAALFPGDPDAGAWREEAHRYLVNGVSLAADAVDQALVAGKPVRDRHVGANFFPHYSLDHHGYLNVGYMVICVSNAALLHFDLKRADAARPESLDHGQAGLWSVLRRFLFQDGRLARIGGDTRVRYAYCQEYALPALLYAADQLRDPHALPLAENLVALMEREADANPDGSFYGTRLAGLRDSNPHYYTRIESDRAVALAAYLNQRPLVEAPPPALQSFEASVAGSWIEEEHGAVFHRSPRRLASFAWRAQGLAQALCTPPGDSSLAEWSLNLTPEIRFLGDLGDNPGGHRRLLDGKVSAFEGGFWACGAIREGVEVRVDEGACCTDQALTQLAFAALPDGRTALGLQRVTAAADRTTYRRLVKSLHLNVPNDLFNGNRRTFFTAAGRLVLTAPPAGDALVPLNSPWVNVDDRLGLVALYGGNALLVDRSVKRRGGKYETLFVEEITLASDRRLLRCAPGETLVDCGYAVLSGSDAAETAAFRGGPLDDLPPEVRGAWATGAEGRRFAFVANFGTLPAALPALPGAPVLPPGEARVMELEAGPPPAGGEPRHRRA